MLAFSYWLPHFSSSRAGSGVTQQSLAAPLQDLGAVAQNHLQELVHRPFPSQAANHHQTLPRRDRRVNVKSTQLIRGWPLKDFTAEPGRDKAALLACCTTASAPSPPSFMSPCYIKCHKEKRKTTQLQPQVPMARPNPGCPPDVIFKSFKRETFLKGQRTKVFLVFFPFKHTHTQKDGGTFHSQASFPEFKFKGKGSPEQVSYAKRSRSLQTEFSNVSLPSSKFRHAR